ncbi:MAG: hypothetical protein PHR28_01690 [candidate division Zixibacteria bacterium]|nr:hypothetical protein [candidate division Zixibacteria bacterium]
MIIATRSFSGCLFGICGIIILVFLLVLVIQGGAWIAAKILPVLPIFMEIVIGFDLFILLPLAIFRKTRRLSGDGLYMSSYAYGVTLWIWAFLLTYTIWGALAVIIGLFIVGVGVVPIAMLATAIKGQWQNLGLLISLLILTFGARSLGVALRRSSVIPPSDSWVEEIKE